MKLNLVAGQTFKQIYQSKILFNILFLGAFLVATTYIASEFSYGVAKKVVLDVGLGILSLSSVSIGIFLGSTLIQKEMESRTLYMVISRPVSRYTFLLGKLLGLAGIMTLNVIILFLVLALLYIGSGGEISSLILWSAVNILLEALMVMFLSVTLSLMMNNILAVLSTISFYVVGFGVDSVRETSTYQLNDFLKLIIDGYSKFMPNFTVVNLKSYALYEVFLPEGYILKSVLYGGLWIIIFTIISMFLISRKEFS